MNIFGRKDILFQVLAKKIQLSLIIILMIRKVMLFGLLLPQKIWYYPKKSNSHKYLFLRLIHSKLEFLWIWFLTNPKLHFAINQFYLLEDQELPKLHQFWCILRSSTRVLCSSKEWICHQQLLPTNSKLTLKPNVISKLVKILLPQEIKKWHYSLMISICLRWTNGVIKKPWKWLDNWLIWLDSGILIKLLEVNSKQSRNWDTLEQWTSLEEEEMIFPIDLKDNLWFSIWFFPWILKSFMDPLLNIN